jgi:hypothetical protein
VEDWGKWHRRCGIAALPRRRGAINWTKRSLRKGRKVSLKKEGKKEEKIFLDTAHVGSVVESGFFSRVHSRNME